MLSPKTLFHIVMAVLVGLSPELSASPVKSATCDIEIMANAQAIEQERKMNENGAGESPIACNLNALDKEQRRRHQSLTAELRAITQETRELPDGYSFRLPSDEATVQRTAEWVVMERRCCPFIDFKIEVGREGGPLLLSLTGREGVKAFLKMELDINK
jgi:hypothetical protein